MAFRFLVLSVGFAFLFSLAGFNLYRLQVDQGARYVEIAQARLEAMEALELRRGQIFFTDRSGTAIPVALNRDYPVVYASPREVGDLEETAASLAPIVGWREDELLRALGNRDSLFKLLVERAKPEVTDAVTDLNAKGIYVGEKQYRHYPFLSLAAHTIGFVGVNASNPEPRGLYGIEKLENEALAGGADVRFTIDRNLQAEAEGALARLIPEFKATGGTIIIEEPRTGKILALANAPGFDPNRYSQYPVGSFMNPAVQLVYEPGSVMKPLTMAAGIDAGVLTPETTFVDLGSVTLNGKTIRNFDGKAYGKVTMRDVIERSINTGSIYAEGLVGHTRFLEYLRRFGFGEVTGVDLPDEIPGSLKNLTEKDARAVDFATASFGQGTAVTPLQLVNAFAAIANGGLLMRPFVGAAWEPTVVRRAVSPETARAVADMMESAVRVNRIAAIPGYGVAGKTGTALIPDFTRGGYTNELIHTYVGFAPVSDPRFVILVKLDRPQVGELAGLTVVPTFRELAQFLLSYYNVPPDRLAGPPPTP